MDDIIFLNGWHESLKKNAKDGTIVGFSMLNSDGKTIQDFGYDLIKLDDTLTSKALHKGKLKHRIKLPQYRNCSAVCGCAMWISRKVLDKVNKFPLDGYNRWGEMIFSALAKKKGFKTLVLSSHLMHLGNSTKQKKNYSLSSISWLIERDMWKKVSLKYFNETDIKKSFYSKFSVKFLNAIKNSENLLIYGCGTISNIISKNSQIKKKAEYASNLPEEIGRKFQNKIIKNFKRINFLNYDKIFISSVGYEKSIIKQIPKKFFHKIICIKKSIKKNNFHYSLENINKFLNN